MIAVDGPQLKRYATLFNGVEVNSTFYTLPRITTVERWCNTVPAGFRFAVKTPRSITHALQDDQRVNLRAFGDVVSAFGDKAGPVLVQLPPARAYDAVAAAFLHRLVDHGLKHVVVEPRHPSWFTPAVTGTLLSLGMARVAADPPRVPEDGEPAGDDHVRYYRLHGTPRIYWSAYDADALTRWYGRITRAARSTGQVWVVFDNTAAGAAAENALEMASRFRP
ncbi:MAG: DUF72 domain-containing protein [Flavobacteriales bacterium]